MVRQRGRGDDRGGGAPRGPKPSIALVPKEISAKEIKVDAELYNSAVERRIRFSINGVVAGIDAIIQTVDKKAEHVFKVPTKTEDVRLRVETIGEPKIYDEIAVVIPSTPQKKKAEEAEKKMKIDISGPVRPGNKFIMSIFTEGPKERVTISSNVALVVNQLDPPAGQTGPANFFNIETGPQNSLHLELSFKGTDAVLVCRHPAANETHERMLIK